MYGFPQEYFLRLRLSTDKYELELHHRSLPAPLLLKDFFWAEDPELGWVAASHSPYGHYSLRAQEHDFDFAHFNAFMAAVRGG